MELLAFAAPLAHPPARLRARVRAIPLSQKHGLVRPLLRRPGAVFATALAMLLIFAMVGQLSSGPALGAVSTLTVISDGVELRQAGGPWSAATDGVILRAGDAVRTSATGRGVVTFFDGSTVSLDPSTEIVAEELEVTAGGPRVIALFQAIGRTWSSVQRSIVPGSRFEIRTPAATAAVRGTGFETEVETSGRTVVSTTDGLVDVKGADAAVSVGAAQRTVVETGLQPVPPITTAPRRGVTFSSDGPLLIVDPTGLACGLDRGAVVRQIARCLVSAGERTTVTLAEPTVGQYRLVLRADRDTTVSVGAAATAGAQVVASRAAVATLAGGATFVGSISLDAATDGSLRLGAFSVFTSSQSPAKVARTGASPVPTAVAAVALASPAATITAPRSTAAVASPAVPSVPTATPAPAPTPQPATPAPTPQPATPAPTAAPATTPAPTPQPPTTAPTAEPTAPTSTATPAPAATPTAAPDVVPPTVSLGVPASIGPETPQVVTIAASVRDSGTGVESAPTATADVRGSGMSLIAMTWDPASGRFSATFAIDRTDAPVVFAVTAKDRAGNEGTGSAVTQISGGPAGSTPTPTPAATPTPTPAATPAPAPTSTPAPAPVADATPPSVTVTAPAAVGSATPQTVTISAAIQDSGTGVAAAPEATADVRGSGMALLGTSWDPATGQFTATFSIDRTDGPIVFTVTAVDRAGNQGSGTATTQIASN